MRRRFALLCNAALLAFFAAGCDSNEENESEFARFEAASWTVTRIEIRSGANDDLFSDITGLLNAEYEQVVFAFFENDTRGRRFNIVGNADESGQDVELRGDFRLDADDNEATFLPDAREAMFADYAFESTTRVTLDFEDQYGGFLLDFLFGDNDFGEFVDARLVIEQSGLSALE